MREERITSAFDFLEMIHNIKEDRKRNEHISCLEFYRGHADKSWCLVPSITREYLLSFEHDLVYEFKRMRPDEFPDTLGMFDTIAKMQHYGMHTRLLDVSSNPSVRVHWNNRGKKSVVWRCVNRLEEKGSDCPSQTIAEEVLHTRITIAINQIIAGRDSFMTILSKNIETVLGTEFDMDTDAIDVKLGTLQDEIMRLASSKSDYDNLAAEIHRLRSMKQETQEHNAQRQTKRQRISEMAEFLDMQSGVVAEYDDKLTRQLIEQITVFDDKLQVSFKSGVDIEVEI